MAPPESDEEITESDDNNQFRVVSHTTKFDLQNICDNFKDNADLTSLKKIDVNK